MDSYNKIDKILNGFQDFFQLLSTATYIHLTFTICSKVMGFKLIERPYKSKYTVLMGKNISSHQYQSEHEYF